MEGLWIIIAIVAFVFKVLNKAGEMKERLPEDFGEKRLPPVNKDWGFPWEEENEGDEEYGWSEYTEPPEKGSNSAENTAKNTVIEISNKKAIEIPMGTAKENIRETQTNLQQEQVAAGIYNPLMDSAGLINGLILSELLQPPKSRRPGRRF